MFKNREMSRLVLDVDLRCRADGAAAGRFDREQVRVLFNQLEFRTLLPRILDAVGEVADAPEAEMLEVDVIVARDAAAAEAALLRPPSSARVAIEARWGGARRTEPAVGPRGRDDAMSSPTSTARCSPIRIVRDALGALVGGESRRSSCTARRS